jgi:hypothetical protein
MNAIFLVVFYRLLKIFDFQIYLSNFGKRLGVSTFCHLQICIYCLLILVISNIQFSQFVRQKLPVSQINISFFEYLYLT